MIVKFRLSGVLRCGLALVLVTVSVWLLSQAVDLPSFSVPDTPDTEISSGFPTSLLASQIPSGDQALRDGQALSGWPRLLLFSSPLLSSGEKQVMDHRLTDGNSPAGQDPGTPPNSSSPSDSSSPDSSIPIDPDEQEDVSPPDLTPPSTEESVLEMTVRGDDSGRYLQSQGVYLYNRSGIPMDSSILNAGQVAIHPAEGPQILIVHSHGTEAYSPADGDTYTGSESYRTTDCLHNVVRVGAEIATVFRAHGLRVIHDPTPYDYPSYNDAYTRSGAAVQQWLEKYPDIQIVLDVHRDAIEGANGEVWKLVSEEAGEKVAQVMFVMGSNGAGGYHPNWKNNLALAVHLQKGLVRGYSSLVRPIDLRSGRFNQYLCQGSMLVEVGGHGNTMTEALAGARLWADNVARTLTPLLTEQS